ncbi:MAG TPA: threonylcarbamoyl-AMP synthase [Candidatus Marinimicrobia bacterium]|nr:threonylcarbamoyl-AMP synthase [Candidatus Neomarinimicrobiota bacterium]
MVRILSVRDPLAISVADKIVRKGLPLVYPTDTIYGLGGDAMSPELVERIYKLKKRPPFMPLSVMLASVQEFDKFSDLSESARRLIAAFLPGALTIILPLEADSPLKHIANADGMAGFRIPSNSFCLDLCARAERPIITSSVNYSGQPPLTRISDMTAQFGDLISIYVKDDKLENSKSLGSTIIRLLNNEIEFLREGAIPKSTILDFMRNN